MFKSFEKKGNVYFLEGKTAIKTENYRLESNKNGVKNANCSPYSSPLVFAKCLSDVKVKHIGKFPIVEGGLESLEQTFLMIQEKDLFDLNEITIGKDVDDSVKEMLERIKNKNNVELGLDQDNKQESTQSLEDKKQEQSKTTNELTEDDIANFGDDNAYTLEEVLESDPDMINHIDQKVIENNIKQFDENNLDDLDLDSNDISKNKYSTSSAVNEEEALELQSLDFDEDPAEQVLDKLLSKYPMDIKNIEFDDYDPTNNSLKPNVEQTESVKKVTSFDKMESEKNSLLSELSEDSKPDIKTSDDNPSNKNRNSKRNGLSSRPS